MIDRESLIVTPETSIRTALARLDRGGLQVVFVEDARGRLVGAVSDGDIRRGLLSGSALEDSVDSVMNRAPATVHPSATQQDVDALKTQRGIRIVAVVDDGGRMVDVVGERQSIATPLDTPVVLMAGGRGQRLYPITKDIPKPLVPLGDVPMIDIILGRLHDQGFRRVYVSVNHLGHLIEEHLGDGSRLDLEITYLHEPAPLGTAGALAQLQDEIAVPFVVMNSDLLTQVDLRRMLAFHQGMDAAATIGAREYGFEIPFGVIRREGDDVVALAEKPYHSELVSAGMYVLQPRALESLVADEYCDMPTLLARLMEAGQRVGAFEIHEEWIDVGRPEDLERARQAWERRQR
ncbi:MULTISPECIES: nucleotidyltransferase family protein [unclassified Microbacterium]|uniref:nucleotidyltransferase family protein n=1 Tax=unclassified Microbacterium TaxID=2609290 RepID=UPI000EA89FD2|nr:MULTISPECIES: nucleotidyltransferase family protein [unclassified Microbacterium]MBT2485383.1 nucleotidyltransferase family protein [Microbacterium sp. ISL-108]RKN68186.1 CBS domain-containing protein [Microbacterium sp. CGR2]